MDKYQNKYRIASARAQWWDYGWNGAYFITICTRNREHYFGEIENGKMVLSPMGIIADILWHEIPNHASFVELGDFVVMPNHIHGILILDKPNGGNDNVVADNDNVVTDNNNVVANNDIDIGIGMVETGHAETGHVETGHLETGHAETGHLETGHALSLQTSDHRSNPTVIGQKRFQHIGKNTVSSIIGSYKSAVTKHGNRLGLENGWQSRFHDYIIRNNAEYQYISNYIINNPVKWQEDKFYGI
jgi:putative transposase